MFADVFVGGLSVTQILIAIVIIAACVALAYVAMRHFEVTPPAWAIKVFWIVVVAIVVIFAIRLVASL